MSRRNRLKRSSDDSHEGAERWLVSYADFITLLFAFFIVLYATSEKDSAKAKQFENSVKRFLIRSGGSAGGGGASVEKYLNKGDVVQSTVPSLMPRKVDFNKVRSEMDEVIEVSFSNIERKKYIYDLYQGDLGIGIVVLRKHLFNEDKVSLRAEAKVFLDKIRSLRSELKLPLAIEAHLNNKKYGGFRAWPASALSAALLASRLQDSRYGSTMAMARGATVPLLPGSVEANERIEFIFISSNLDL